MFYVNITYIFSIQVIEWIGKKMVQMNEFPSTNFIEYLKSVGFMNMLKCLSANNTWITRRKQYWEFDIIDIAYR